MPVSSRRQLLSQQAVGQPDGCPSCWLCKSPAEPGNEGAPGTLRGRSRRNTAIDEKLRTLKEGSKLRLLTPLRPVLRQETRRGSTHAMLRRYFELRGFLSMDNEDIAEYLPSLATHRRLKVLRDEISDCESVSLALQKDDIDLLGARGLLDGLIAVKPILKTYLGASANIIHSLSFESGCCKVLAGESERLSRAEKAAMQPFERVEETGSSKCCNWRVLPSAFSKSAR